MKKLSATPITIYDTLDLEQAAHVAKVHSDTMADLAPEIPGAAKIGRAWVFVKADLIEWIREQSRMQREARKRDVSELTLPEKRPRGRMRRKIEPLPMTLE